MYSTDDEYRESARTADSPEAAGDAEEDPIAFPPELDEEGLEYAEATRVQRRHAIRLVLAGRALELERERDPERLKGFIARQAGVDLEVAAALIEGAPPETLGLTPEQTARARNAAEVNPEVPHVFAEGAQRATRAVGRLVGRNSGAGQGTCFMISPRLLATAGHALRDEAMVGRRLVEFNFAKVGDQAEIHARFSLDPAKLFLPLKQFGLDCSLVALGGFLEGTPFTPSHCPLDGGRFKHALGFFANVIHHPDGLPELVLRDNRLIDRDESVLVYRTRTQPGSSGSPVFNDQWEVIAVHFWGRTVRTLNLCKNVRVVDRVNRGVRASAIVTQLTAMFPTLSDEQQELLVEAIPSLADEPAVA